MENEQPTPCAQRIIWLKNGVRQGNPNLNAKRCGAKAKTTGRACMGMALKNKDRCRLHGGKSTGPRSLEGLERSRRANLKHGLYSQETKILLALVRYGCIR